MIKDATIDDKALSRTGLDVLVRGSGPGLLLAHGAGGGIEGNYGLVLDDLARDHTAIGPHYPGAGRTPVADGPLQLDDLTDRLVDAAVEAGHEKFAVFGESLGTTLAVRAATRHPERVTALVLTAGFAVADPVLRLASRLIPGLTAAGDRRTAARFACMSCMTDEQLSRISAADLDELVEQTLATMPPGTPDHFDLCARVDVREDLARVAVPALVVVATGDRLVLPESQRRLAAGIPGARLVELPGAAHVLGESDRATWLRHVREFLSQQG
ncbi:alpha/beta fold hydrolase [Saccharopolyspora taberi]|uniref:AB hydrolase-1 domain-containing protein n=1 Tax=Saccharopolyspora taberi TaxID=60895 RepID=A0ABN3V5S6_9PSEU